MNYKFSIQIDDENHTLSSEKGISMQYLSELLRDLYKAIDMDNGDNCTLSNVRGNCYALDFVSEKENHYERFKIVHKNIERLNLIDLNQSERKYADTLKKVLGGRYYLNAFDSDKKIVASIKGLGELKELKCYYTQKTVYGILSEIGGKTINTENKHVRLDGVNYQISISKDDDLSLKEYYRTRKLKIKIKQKRSIKDNSVISAEMLGFEPVGEKSLSENLKETGFIDFNMTRNIKTVEDIIDKLYGDS